MFGMLRCIGLIISRVISRLSHWFNYVEIIPCFKLNKFEMLFLTSATLGYISSFITNRFSQISFVYFFRFFGWSNDSRRGSHAFLGRWQNCSKKDFNGSEIGFWFFTRQSNSSIHKYLEKFPFLNPVNM